jgi:hypothetical protein
VCQFEFFWKHLKCPKNEKKKIEKFPFIYPEWDEEKLHDSRKESVGDISGQGAE